MNLIEQEAFDAIVRHLGDSTIDMFGSYGIGISQASEERISQLDVNAQSVVASIGYAGDKIRGALVLIASRPAIESWLWALGEPNGGGDVCDTLGEFSNMLLGRLKGRLLSDGLPILLSTPTTAVGSGLRLARPAGAHVRLVFEGPNWDLEVLIGATFEEGFLFNEPAKREVAAEAGEMLLF
jgi:CheY-specific phosphatase CheX